MKTVVLFGCLVGLTGWHTARAQEASEPRVPVYWGMESGAGTILVPKALSSAIQNRYSASMTGPVFSIGVVRYHPNGAPNFSLQFLHFGLDAQASDLKTGLQYSGSAAISGFLASKHVSFISRKRLP